LEQPTGAEQPELKSITADNQTLAFWDWPGEDPPLIFAHATGFHGRCWDYIIRRFPGRRRIAVDFRGHGRSSKPSPEPNPNSAPAYLWKNFGSDLAAIADSLKLRDAVGIGHSMGGYCTVCAAARRPETYSALLLIDPTIFAENLYGTEPPAASFILRRRNVWSSPEEMFARFRDRPPFVRWKPEILRDYCDFGLLPSGHEFVLACPPEVEAAIYGQSKTHEANPYREIRSIRQPVTVLRAGTARDPAVFDLSASPTAVDLASHFVNGRDALLPECSHYIAMEAPERVAAEIGQILTA
jgi:lipase